MIFSYSKVFNKHDISGPYLTDLILCDLLQRFVLNILNWLLLDRVWYHCVKCRNFTKFSHQEIKWDYGIFAWCTLILYTMTIFDGPDFIQLLSKVPLKHFWLSPNGLCFIKISCQHGTIIRTCKKIPCYMRDPPTTRWLIVKNVKIFRSYAKYFWILPRERNCRNLISLCK